MNASHVKWAARLFVTIGVVIVLGEVLRNWIQGHEIEGWVIAIGATFGFFGFYLMNPKGALGAYGFVVDSSVKIIGVVRSGRRSTDNIVAVAAPPDAAVPDPVLGKPTNPEEVP